MAGYLTRSYYSFTCEGCGEREGTENRNDCPSCSESYCPSCFGDESPEFAEPVCWRCAR